MWNFNYNHPVFWNTVDSKRNFDFVTASLNRKSILISEASKYKKTFSEIVDNFEKVIV